MGSLKDIPQMFLEKARKKKRKIGIAIMRPVPETVESLKKAAEFADITVVGAKIDGFENVVEPDQDKASESLIRLLREGSVEGIVRGQVKDSYTLDEFYRQFQREPLPSNRKVCPCILKKGEYSFIASTVSIYQGWTVEDKKYEVDRIVRYMEEDLGVTPKIGILSTLRPTSKHGKIKLLDELFEVNKEIAEYMRQRGYDVHEYYFEYETAVWNHSNLIVPAVGLVGNAWLKALMYLGDWKLIACPYLDLGVVYEDGSRNETDFFWHIVHAVALCNKEK